jgi:N-acetylglucosaminyl-diphospho-decaprenol L-rhamnosyltransferase
MMPEDGDLACVILTYGSEPSYGSLVDQLHHQGILNNQITVIHNPIVKSTETIEVLDGVEVVHNPANLGYAAAMNVGLQRYLAGSSSAVLLMSHDVQLGENTIARILHALDNNRHVGVFGLELRRASGEIWSLGGICGRGGGVSHLRSVSQLTRTGAAEGAGIAECDWVDGASWVFRREVLLNVGLLEEDYFMYYEEPLICLRARRAGWGVATIIGARAEQAPGGTKRPAAYAFLMSRNRLGYAREFGGLNELLYGLAALSRNAAKEYMKAHMWRRSTTERMVHRAHCIGICRGVVAMFRGEWGAPPLDLPGPTDIIGTQP